MAASMLHQRKNLVLLTQPSSCNLEIEIASKCGRVVPGTCRRLALSWSLLVDSQVKFLLSRTASNMTCFKVLHTVLSGVLPVHHLPGQALEMSGVSGLQSSGATLQLDRWV